MSGYAHVCALFGHDPVAQGHRVLGWQIVATNFHGQRTPATQPEDVTREAAVPERHIDNGVGTQAVTVMGGNGRVSPAECGGFVELLFEVVE